MNSCPLPRVTPTALLRLTSSHHTLQIELEFIDAVIGPEPASHLCYDLCLRVICLAAMLRPAVEAPDSVSSTCLRLPGGLGAQAVAVTEDVQCWAVVSDNRDRAACPWTAVHYHVSHAPHGLAARLRLTRVTLSPPQLLVRLAFLQFVALLFLGGESFTADGAASVWYITDSCCEFLK